MKRKIHPLLGFIFLTGCAHQQTMPTFISPSPLTVTGLDEQNKEQTYQTNANEAFTLKNSYSKIEENGHLPLLVTVPDSQLVRESSAHPIEIKLRSVDEWKGETTERYIATQMDALYIDLLQIITSAKGRDVDTAMKKIDSVIARFPKLASAYYVKAQVEILSGKTSEALSTLDIALKIRPEFKEALALQEQLRSKK
jgi:tetratricopeptide (TPR) repeat protein